METMHLDAIGAFRLVTTDLSRLGRFYQEVLGFERIGEQIIPGEEMALLGLPGGGRRLHLGIGAQRLALDQFDVGGRPYPDEGDAASLWFQHLALVVDDIGAAYGRLRDFTPISHPGPQHLPPSSGSVGAFKFRDPDGHPLELLQFPRDGAPAPWRGRAPDPGQIASGIDHSAISVASAEISAEFYGRLGLEQGDRTVNQGTAQQHLDDLPDVEVEVLPMRPRSGTPHLELLCYRHPRERTTQSLRPNDVAATRIVWSGSRPALLSDPDGHLQQVESR